MFSIIKVICEIQINPGKVFTFVKSKIVRNKSLIALNAIVWLENIVNTKLQILLVN